MRKQVVRDIFPTRRANIAPFFTACLPASEFQSRGRVEWANMSPFSYRLFACQQIPRPLARRMGEHASFFSPLVCPLVDSKAAGALNGRTCPLFLTACLPAGGFQDRGRVEWANMPPFSYRLFACQQIPRPRPLKHALPTDNSARGGHGEKAIS